VPASDVFIAVLAFVALTYGLVLFNHLVHVKHNVTKAWANVDVLLRQRHDELPKLVAICARYARHERALLDRIAATRAALSEAGRRRDTRALGPLEQALRLDLGAVQALAERYPALEADAAFRALQRRISELETAIADRREFFNATVAVHNVEIARVPNALLARPAGMRALHPFSCEDVPRGVAPPRASTASAE
jgi:LemA protein